MENDEEQISVFVQIDNSQPRKHAVNRITFRCTTVRERGGQEYEFFPPSSFAGVEVPIGHNCPAFIMPATPIGPEPLPIQTGWVKEPALVAILNSTRLLSPFRPTKEEIAAVQKSVALIGFAADYFPLRLAPGMTQYLWLQPGAKLYVKAEAGEPLISIFAA